ncbi:carbohydrate-responsive element-binding protein isoform X2 [Gouania willdenowi]|uniref:carbohydrate-responsive element-binding protein isoform X2 n=1 Tax=Gouania willdenowi TaxID=441366 RepID=UPI001055CEFD|nr:carbohydrate-responsive element-binding protein-like isoform X2 [Gouania willdenowi]
MADKHTVCCEGHGHLQDSSESDSEPAPRVFLTRSQVIHSGHFMVSSPHSDSAARRRRSGGPLSSGSLSIDPTLTRLFECMSLAYSGKIVSPKWKSFKGLRLLWRDKIRLNNAIWRAWFIQYVEKRKNPVCGFVTPLEGSEADAHRKPEAIILEGSYWKRRIEVVIKEYHKWRIYYKKRGPICQSKLDQLIYQEPEAAPVEAHMFDLDCLLSDISDTLFTMTQKPCLWASDRHNTHMSNADIIQPGLTPLQPNLDDFMDIPDIFMNYRSQSTEQTDFADCGYFESSSSTSFSAVPPPVETVQQQLIDTQMPQANLSPESISQLSASIPRTDAIRLIQECCDYRTSGPVSLVTQYGNSSYHDAPVSFPASTDQPASSSVPFLRPLLCHKFGYYTTASMTSTVITHTTSSAGAPVSVQQAQEYKYPPEPYCQTSYSAALSNPINIALPSVTPAYCFSVPEQMVNAGVRKKHEQKTGGTRTASSTDSAPQPAAHPASDPTHTSCLAKLLSSSGHERKPAVGFDSSLVTIRGHRSSSPSPLISNTVHVAAASSHLQQGSGAASAAVLSVLGHSSSSKGLAVSTQVTHGSTHTSTTPLIPKTEKLSPVQIYGPEMNSLTVNFPAHPGQISPPNPLEKVSNLDTPLLGFSGHVRLDSCKQTETRRITHISAEQKRRFNIKLGFDTLHNLVTTLSSQPSIKISKATTLQKTAEYISKMQQERAQLHEETQRLREEIQLLNSAINACQQQLPATGVPITQQRFDLMRQKFREYVHAQTLQNWKFWIFSIIIEPLFESYNGMVSTASVDDLCRSTLSWLDQHCSLPALRPILLLVVLSSLRLLSTTTAILTDPSLLPEQATLAVTQGDLSATLDQSLQASTQQ